MIPTDANSRLPLFFVALMPTGEAKAQIHNVKLQNSSHFACRQAMKTPPHITIIPPFRLAEDNVRQMIDLVKMHFSPTDGLVVNFGGISSFEERTIYLDILLDDSLKNYDNEAKELVSQNQELFPNVRFHDAFHPHVTLANRDIMPEDFKDMMAFLGEKNYPSFSNNLSLEVLHLDRGRWEIVD